MEETVAAAVAIAKRAAAGTDAQVALDIGPLGELPVFVTMSFEASGRTFTGCTVASMARTLEGLERDEAEELAVSVSTAIAGEIAPYTDGLYLMTPFRRVALMERIILSIGESDLSVSAASRF